MDAAILEDSMMSIVKNLRVEYADCDSDDDYFDVELMLADEMDVERGEKDECEGSDDNMEVAPQNFQKTLISLVLKTFVKGFAEGCRTNLKVFVEKIEIYKQIVQNNGQDVFPYTHLKKTLTGRIMDSISLTDLSNILKTADAAGNTQKFLRFLNILAPILYPVFASCEMAPLVKNVIDGVENASYRSTITKIFALIAIFMAKFDGVIRGNVVGLSILPGIDLSHEMDSLVAESAVLTECLQDAFYREATLL